MSYSLNPNTFYTTTTSSTLTSLPKNRIQILQERINSLKQEAQRIETQLAQIKCFGEDIYPDGAILAFEKSFKLGGKSYQYVMLKQDGLWYSTAQSFRVSSWEEVKVWLAEGPVPVTKLWEVTEFALVEPE